MLRLRSGGVLWVLALIFLALLCSEAVYTHPWDNGVAEVPSELLQNYLTLHANVTVLFYVTWCPWSRKMLPVFAELKEFVQSNVPQTDFVQVRMDRASVTTQDAFNITSYPKIMHFTERNRHTTYGNSIQFIPLLRWAYEALGKPIVVDELGELKMLARASGDDSLAVFVNAHPPRALSNEPHVLAVETADRAVIEFLSQRSGFKGAIGSNPFLALVHPFGNTELLESGSESEGVVSKVGRPVRNSRGVLMSIIEDDEGEGIEHIPYGPGHVDQSLRVLSAPKLTDAELVDFVRTFQFPVITKWSTDSVGRILEVGRPMLIAVVPSNDVTADIYKEMERLMNDADNEDIAAASTLYDMDHIENVLWEVAQRNRRKIVTVFSGTRSLAERRLMNLLGLNTSDPEPVLAYLTLNPSGSGVYTPALKYVAPPKIASQLFRLQKERTTSGREGRHQGLGRALDITSRKDLIGSIQSWLDQAWEKKIPPTIRSEEPIPAQQNKGPVYHLTAMEFQKEVVEREENDYIVDFYAPWCGHCRVMAPVFEEAAQAFRQAGYRNLKFGKLDATANEVLGIPIVGYPTVVLWPSHDKRHPAFMRSTPGNAQQIIEFIASRSNGRIDGESVVKQLSRLQAPDLPPIDEEL
ncbi:putative disulfide isomerase [Gregarina niphandrodes]|uniref:Disulfide isomerase n=1 Tax=Gregarina niphandrodes TaxID=110365 RepID=A0A023BBR5_GRENI|nr:putative disulfide isomerase [Gregarina niphandrodes]EZG79935.1 putative disulfide isomerase [Gregarina niphandrodes]|eukprot:XP_011134354.1 putative disulfide isomerase [Gregarina niphandrodes]